MSSADVAGPHQISPVSKDGVSGGVKLHRNCRFKNAGVKKG